ARAVDGPPPAAGSSCVPSSSEGGQVDFRLPAARGRALTRGGMEEPRPPQEDHAAAQVVEMPELLTTVAAPAAGQTISGTRRCATANSKLHSSSTSACAS